jgi:hypothetical protein
VAPPMLKRDVRYRRHVQGSFSHCARVRRLKPANYSRSVAAHDLPTSRNIVESTCNIRENLDNWARLDLGRLECHSTGTIGARFDSGHSSQVGHLRP